MALGANVVSGQYRNYAGCVAPVSITAPWQTIIAAGGPALLDNANITNPTTQIVRPTTSLFILGTQATNLLLRLAYADALSSITSPVVKVFGRLDSNNAWQLLKAKASVGSTTLTATLTADATNDVTDGTYKYTTPDFQNTCWDCLGCTEILVGIQTVLAGTGTVNTSFIQAKGL